MHEINDELNTSIKELYSKLSTAESKVSINCYNSNSVTSVWGFYVLDAT